MGESIAEVAAIAAKLTKNQRAAIVQFDPGVYYGVACPSGVPASVKGRFTTIMILNRIWSDRVGGAATHILTTRGEAVRNHLISQGADHDR